MTLAPERLAALEVDVDHALASGDLGPLRVLGYGEISCVLALDGHACKRLPPFADEARVLRYRDVLERYLAALAEAGIAVVSSTLAHHRRADGRFAVFCVQPIVDAEALGPRLWARAAAHDVEVMFDGLVDAVLRAVGPRLGLDGQLSNWAWIDGRARYFDVSTPFLRDDAGHELLDTELFVSALPWAMRAFARRFLVRSIIDKYYQPRAVIVDLLANLYKERLAHLVPALIERANRRVQPAIAPREPARYYAGDKRLWAMLQVVRRMDRAWQRGIRRRPYPFLLPGRIER